MRGDGRGRVDGGARTDGTVRTDGRAGTRSGDWNHDGHHHHHDGHHHHGHHHHIVGPWWTWGWGWGLGWGGGYGGYGGYYDDYAGYGYSGYGNGSYYDDRVYADGGYAQPNGAARPVNIAGLEVQLPSPDAEVWLQGEKQTGSGSMRRFYSPQLEPGKSYTYTINAAWFENGELVTQKRQVDVQADTLSRIDSRRDQNLRRRRLRLNQRLNRHPSRVATATPAAASRPATKGPKNRGLVEDRRGTLAARD